MTYEVQVQELKVKRFYIDAESEDEIRSFFNDEGIDGLYDDALGVEDGEEDTQLLSIAEVNEECQRLAS